MRDPLLHGVLGMSATGQPYSDARPDPQPERVRHRRTGELGTILTQIPGAGDMSVQWDGGSPGIAHSYDLIPLDSAEDRYRRALEAIRLHHATPADVATIAIEALDHDTEGTTNG